MKDPVTMTTQGKHNLKAERKTERKYDWDR